MVMPCMCMCMYVFIYDVYTYHIHTALETLDLSGNAMYICVCVRACTIYIHMIYTRPSRRWTSGVMPYVCTCICACIYDLYTYDIHTSLETLDLRGYAICMYVYLRVHIRPIYICHAYGARDFGIQW